MGTVATTMMAILMVCEVSNARELKYDIPDESDSRELSINISLRMFCNGSKLDLFINRIAL
jgi:hypothetical protein